MGTTWNYFKRYDNKPESGSMGSGIIHYLDGGEIELSHGTSAGLASILEHYDICLPVYDWTEPPVTKTLELIPPINVAGAALRTGTLKNRKISHR